MPVVMDNKKYERLLVDFAPVFIETDEEQDRLAEILLHLTIPPRKLSPEEERMAKLIGHLVDDYERRATEGKVKRMAPCELLAYLMELHDLKQADLAEIFGGQSVVSAVLAGKRPINLGHARKLAARFHVSIEAFIR